MQSVMFYIVTVLETAGRIVAKCDQPLVLVTEFVQKIAQELRFGRPAFERESGMIFYIFLVKFLDKSIKKRCIEVSKPETFT